jgi:hypothetical protein
VNKEVIKEMQLLEIIEKQELLENKKMKEKLSVNEIFTNILKIFDKESYKEIVFNNRLYNSFTL